MRVRPSLRDGEPATPVAERDGALSHLAAFYAGADDYLAAVIPFLRDGQETDDATFVAVPADRLDMVRDGLGADSSRVTFADMSLLGANPGRIIPAIQGFLDDHRGRRVRFVGEPIWPSRCACELREATRHESLINLAFAAEPIAILCPYDTSVLAPSVIADAERTHPTLVRGGRSAASAAYGRAWRLPASCDGPLPEPPADAEEFRFSGGGDLARLRHHLGDRAREAGFDVRRISDLEVAVSEVLTNTLRYAPGGGSLRIWGRDDRLYCQVDDEGRLEDPLAGRRAPVSGSVGGWGLLLANRVCDLVEIRSGSAGTAVRLHLSNRDVAAAA